MSCLIESDEGGVYCVECGAIGNLPSKVNHQSTCSKLEFKK